MRFWSLHPQYLDTQGLLAAWREGLLAQKVLLGETRGYRHHPQLERFRLAPDPARHAALRELASPLPHPLFHLVPGPMADWERPTDTGKDLLIKRAETQFHATRFEKHR